MGNVGERSSVNENGSSFESLHDVGFDSVLHQDGERSSASNVVASNGFSLGRFTDDHSTETEVK